MTTDKSKPRYRFSCLLRAIFLLIGVPALLLGTIGFLGLYGSTLPSTIEGNGSIVAITNETADCPTYQVAFTAIDGSQTTFEQEYCFDQGVRVGQTVTILYDPQHPDLYPTIVQRTQSGWLRVAGYMIVGLVFILLALLPLRVKSHAGRPSASAADNSA